MRTSSAPAFPLSPEENKSLSKWDLTARERRTSQAVQLAQAGPGQRRREGSTAAGGLVASPRNAHQLPRCRGTWHSTEAGRRRGGSLCAPLALGQCRGVSAVEQPLLPHPRLSSCSSLPHPHRPLRSLPRPSLNRSITLKCEEPPIPVCGDGI